MVQAHAHELLNQKNDSREHPLVTATQRLVTALEQLERKLSRVDTLAERDVQQHEKLVFFERENESLRKERKTLDTTITQLEDQYNELHKVAGAIYNKLDDSIKRLTQIIEG